MGQEIETSHFSDADFAAFGERLRAETALLRDWFRDAGFSERVDQRYPHLATLFSRTILYFTRPRGVQSLALSQLCPAVTVECSQPGQTHGMEHARDFIDACLHLAEIPVHAVAPHDIDLFHTVATIKVPDRVCFGFDEGELRTRRPVMPSMFTLDERVIRQDCLGYLMERYQLVAAEG